MSRSAMYTMSLPCNHWQASLGQPMPPATLYLMLSCAWATVVRLSIKSLVRTVKAGESAASEEERTGENCK